MIRRLATILRAPSLLTAALGMLFGLSIYPIWNLEGRWFFIAIVGLILVFVSLFFVARFADFLMIALFFSLPLAGFNKWFGLEGFPDRVMNAIPYSGGFGIGILDIVLAGLYANWFFRIFVTRQAPLPSLHAYDIPVLLLLAAYFLSVPGTYSITLSFFAIEYLFIHVLYYFYLSRHIQWRFMPWLLASLIFAFFLESGIGVLQSQLDMFPGLALDKGAGSETLDQQYDVPGVENTTRATGTLYDSHALGLYMTMLCCYALALVYAPFTSRGVRITCAFCCVLGVLTIIVTYSRAAWLAFAIAMGLILWVLIFIWQRMQALRGLFVVFLLSLPFVPYLLGTIVDRFANAPIDVLTVRFEQWRVAASIWQSAPWFGYGVGNYMYALREFNFNMAEELPVHNATLWMLAESGLFGALAFYLIVISTLWRFGRWILSDHDPIRWIALGAFAALIAYMFDGMSNPLFRDPVVYKLFWLSVAVSVALPRLQSEAQEKEAVC